MTVCNEANRVLNSFGDVVDLYNATRPLRSKRFTIEDDVRPYGKRRHAYDRIMKFSDREYGILTWSVPSNASPYLRGRDYDTPQPRVALAGLHVPEEVTKQYCPVLWTRKDDADYLEIRASLHVGDSAWYACVGHTAPMWVSTEPVGVRRLRRLTVRGITSHVLLTAGKRFTIGFWTHPAATPPEQPTKAVYRVDRSTGAVTLVNGKEFSGVYRRVSAAKKAAVEDIINKTMAIAKMKYMMTTAADDLPRIAWSIRRIEELLRSGDDESLAVAVDMMIRNAAVVVNWDMASYTATATLRPWTEVRAALRARLYSYLEINEVVVE